MTLVARGLHHRFAGVTALAGVSVEAQSGRTTVVIGPNAAGKSTLLRCLAGVLSPTQGDVVLNGVALRSLSPAARAAQVAFVPQRPRVAASFSVAEVVALGRFALPPRPDRVQQAIERWDLGGVADRPFPELSAGQQHRVALARATAQAEPGGCLILDEPTASMDLAHVRSTIDHLRRAVAAFSTIVVSLHDLAVAAVLADDVWVLDRGRLVGAGPVSEMLRPEILQPVFGVAFASGVLEGESIVVPRLGASEGR